MLLRMRVACMTIIAIASIGSINVDIVRIFPQFEQTLLLPAYVMSITICEKPIMIDRYMQIIIW